MSDKKPRHIIPYCKTQVIAVEKGSFGIRWTVRLPSEQLGDRIKWGQVTLTADFPFGADVKVGDLLPLYTEVYADVGDEQVRN